MKCCFRPNIDFVEALILYNNMEKLCGIYKITSPTQKVYIGESLEIETRFKNYKLLRCKKQHKIFASFVKYGVENHIFEIIEICDIDDLKCRERFWQDEFDVLGENGLNLKLTTCGDIKSVHSEETKLKIKTANIGRTHTQETKDSLSLMKKGYIRSEESKQKQSNTMKGIIHSEESRKKMSESSKGKFPTIETRLKMSLKAKGKFVSEETKVKMSEGSKGINNGRSIKVIDNATGIIYNSIRECAEDLGFEGEHLRQMLNPSNPLRNKTSVMYFIE